MDESGLRRARAAVAVNFLLHGVVWGSWAAQIPLAKDRLGVGAGLFGVALLSLATGAIVAMPLAGALINRFGSRAVVTVSGLAFSLLFIGPCVAPDVGSFIALGLVFGCATGSMDVSMNAHGIAVERGLKRPVMSFLHGAFSVGGLVGAIAGGMLVREVGGLAPVLLVSAVSAFSLLAVRGWLLGPRVDKGLSSTHFAWPTGASLKLGALCFLALMAEGAIIDWSALSLRERFALDAGTAAFGYALFSGGMALSRFGGDTLRARVGSVVMVRVSAICTAIGMAGALLAPDAWLAIGVLILTGVGIGNIAPVLFAGGGRLEPTAPGRGIAAVTSLGYAGFLAGPPLIGFAAEAVGLTGALWLVAAAGVTIALGASVARAADS